MRLLLDANVLLDCLVLEASGQPRAGKPASDRLIELCDRGIHAGFLAWHTLPIVAYYHGRQNRAQDTAAMMDQLLTVFQVPTVAHSDAKTWRRHGLTDFEDALQVASALAGQADILITRNAADFRGISLPVMTPEEFLAANPSHR
jgi:predicted nucleic acid-binding protein